MRENYDFSGWATRANLKCSDGRTIMPDAFKENDGQTVPLVWMHQHNEPQNVLGHALLENRPEGVYMYGKFNDSDEGQHAKMLVRHGDVNALSIYANKLQQKNGNVMHGTIREVSVVLAGANPGAFIDFPILAHGEEAEDEAVIYTGENIELIHADEDKEETEEKETEKGEEKEMPKGKTVKEVFDSMTEEQKNVVYFMIGQALEDAGVGDSDDDDEEDEDMKHNVFDTDTYGEDTLSHAAIETIMKDGKRLGSLKESVLEHAEEYGIDGIEWLFPEDRELNTTPQFIDKDNSWVNVVMSGVHHTPFSRVKSTFADITEDEARAKGYIKGTLKKEEVFSLLKRATTPQTIYKKQKLDRDDVIDITDFDVVAWLKGEMRVKLNEEIARAILIGDGRLASDDDKISEDHVRPIANDAALFTIKAAVTGSDKTNGFIKAAIKSRKDYKGKGNPTLFTTEDLLTDMLLLTDTTGRDLYASEAQLATKLRVSRIVTVPQLEDFKVGNSPLMGIIVNLDDYNVGADKGGAINMFDDFDIDYNRQKYLIETRISGALTTPYSAIVIFDGTTPASVDGGVTKSKTTSTGSGD